MSFKTVLLHVPADKAEIKSPQKKVLIQYLLPVLRPSFLFDIPSVSNIFPPTFFRNHASQPLQTSYGAFAGEPTSCLLNFCPPVIYLIFYDFVYFSI